MRHTIAWLLETIISTLLVAWLTGVFALMAIGVGGSVGELGRFLLHACIGKPAVAPRLDLVGLGLAVTSPLGGAFGSILLWQMTLPFGLISVLAQRLAGPSRRVSVGVGALYGAVWATVLGHVDPMAQLVMDTSMKMNGILWRLSSDTSVGRLALTELYVAIGAFVGLLMPWRRLTRPWTMRARPVL